VFESGAVTPEGRIVGNDNDDDGPRSTNRTTRDPPRDQVQIYESIMGDSRPAPSRPGC
jgi:hypothetical protein